ncbi:MAG: hypothetical protein IJS39_04955 [Synergistaceae bacterium]|nr:hypothetical protein [Synergistaceae bacterium]
MKISIADGATVTLRDVTINGVNSFSYQWAGITCEGNATIVLEGVNSVKGFQNNYPGLTVTANKTLTITGSGSLTASSNGWGAGIGGVANSSTPCGNIVINDGIITAAGGTHFSAGIGSGYGGVCGDITINGGTVTAVGGWNSAGIGSGHESTCGNITISNSVDEVTATRGFDPDDRRLNGIYSIGPGVYGKCGKVTIAGKETGSITQSPYTYRMVTNVIEINDEDFHVLQDGDELTGKALNAKVNIADGATVVLRDLELQGYAVPQNSWTGIGCLGDATIIIKGDNYITGYRDIIMHPQSMLRRAKL